MKDMFLGVQKYREPRLGQIGMDVGPPVGG